MSEAVVIALIAAGIPSAVTLVLYGGRMVDWLVTRMEKRQERREAAAKAQQEAAAKARTPDQEEAVKTTRVLLGTIELKNEELAMNGRIISDLLRDREADQRRIAHLEMLLDGSRR